jgi:hypothetical protein
MDQILEMKLNTRAQTIVRDVKIEKIKVPRLGKLQKRNQNTNANDDMHQDILISEWNFAGI